MRPGFRFRKVKSELLGARPSDWRAYIALYAPLLRDLGEVSSIGDRYVLSVGAHATHQPLLMDRADPEPLTIERSLHCCALLTYALDSPVVPQHSARATYDAPDVKGFDRAFRRSPVQTAERYFAALVEAAEAASVFTDKRGSVSVQRILMPDYPPRGFWSYHPWPPNEAIWRALHAYALGVSAVAVNARILNFWRASEAVTSKATRLDIFSNLQRPGLAPVWAESFGIAGSSRRVNVARELKTSAMRRYRTLVSEHGSPDKALDYLYWEARGKAAHADRKSLEYDSGMLIAALLEDSTLLQFVARVAIERAWASS